MNSRQLLSSFLRVISRVSAQGFTALASYVVSITAAHSLPTLTLAAFFIGWAIESYFIAMIRMILVPSLLISEDRPKVLPIVGLCMAASAPFALATYILSFASLGAKDGVLIALTPVTLGAYEAVRNLLSISARGAALLSVHDSALFFLTVIGAVFISGSMRIDFGAALSSINLAALIVSTAGTLILHRFDALSSERKMLLVWLRQESGLLRLGSLEWVIFFLGSTVALATLRIIGGAEVYAAVRLGETVAAPIGLLGSAIPMLAAGAMRDRKPAAQWPVSLKSLVALVIAVSSIWLIIIQLGPASIVKLFAGTHYRDAREASLGLAAGALFSLWIEAAVLVEKRNGATRFLARTRWVQLSALFPLVLGGAVLGSPLSAGIGISIEQSLPAAPLFIRSIRNRQRGAHRK